MAERCGAKKPNGSTCKSWAGAGTDHVGWGRCKFCGGASPNGMKAAVKEQVASLSNEIDIDPHDVLLRTIRLAWGAVQWCAQVIQSNEYALTLARNEGDLERVIGLEKRLLAFQTIYGEWIDRAAKHAKLALDAGIEERKVRIAESEAALVAEVIRGVLDGLQLNQEQQAIAPALVRKQLLLLAS